MRSSRPRNRSWARAGIVSAAGIAMLATMAGTSAAESPPAERAGTRPATMTVHPALDLILPSNIRLVQTRTSLLGQHKWYRQVADGHIVVGGWYGTHYNRFTHALTVWDGRRSGLSMSRRAPTLRMARAATLAARHGGTTVAQVTATSLEVLAPTSRNARARLVYAIGSADGRGARTSYVDAVDGTVLKTTVVSGKAAGDPKAAVTGTGRVFDPNPVVKLQDESLTDQRDAVHAVPAAGYTRRTLYRLNGSHELSGRYARITNPDRAHSTTDTYVYNRSNPYFEQTNAYYSVDGEQAFLQSLGFTDVNSEAQRVRTNAFAEDNSYYDDTTDQISLGRGGVDDAEDPEVVWHEYGHAIQADQVIDFGWGSQAAAIGEGFGDYMAVTMSQGAAPVGTDVSPAACVMDWDATSYTRTSPHCLRRTNTNKTYPVDLNTDPHLSGEIWSRALWDMNRSMGRDDATRVIVESQFWMYPSVRMPAAAKIMVSTAKRLVQNGLIATGSVTKVRTALLAGHLLAG